MAHSLHQLGLRAAHFLTLAAALAGAWGLWTMHQARTQQIAVDGMEVPQGMWTGGLAEAALRPSFWAAALVALAATILARRLETAVYVAPRSNPTHRLELDPGRDSRRDSGRRASGQHDAVKRSVKRSGNGAGNGSVARPEPPSSSNVSDAVKQQRRRSERRLRMEAFLRGEPDVRAFVDAMLSAALEDGASDVHVEPGRPDGLVRFRVRGELREAARVPHAHQAALVRRIKVMSGLVVYQTTTQDGRMSLDTDWGAVDVRVSVVPTGVPTVDGEKVVLRLAGEGMLLELADLGLSQPQLERLRTLLREPQGLLVATGPTGSGKTTTLYSSLSHVKSKRPGASLASIEDPIEVELPYVAQTQVDRGRGLDFAGALRSVLRQDPDVLMVGEIRDGETAKIAVQAGLSGHLVLTTLHAESAVGIFPRLVDLGVEPFLAASSTLAGISQRLVPKLCEACRRTARPDRDQLATLERLGIFHDGLEFHDAEGCPACGYEGRAGRTAVFEILALGPDLKKRIAAKLPTHELASAARAAGHRTLVDAAVDAAARGDVALSDALALVSEAAS